MVVSPRMQTHVPSLSVMERVGRYMFRPTLRLTHEGYRKVETVQIKYEYDSYKPSQTPNAPLAVDGKLHSFGSATYVRAWVYNVRGFPARNCKVFLESVWLGNRLIDSERTQLAWSDLSQYVFEEMPAGFRYGHYINICFSDSVDPSLKITSQKHDRGYHRYEEHGVFTFELRAEAAKPCHFGLFMIKVKYTGGPNGLCVLTTRAGNNFFNWGWKINPESETEISAIG